VEELLRRSNEAQSIYVLVAIGLMAVALFFSRFVAKSITLPIQRLCDSMERVQEGDFSVSDIVVDSENEIGSLTRMGPGYFPLIISTGIILTGLAIAVKSLLLTPALPSEGRIELGRPFSGLLILGSVALYAATLLTLGFVLSISLMVIAASCAHPLFRLRDAVISAVILTTLSALLFVGGLGLIVPMWPTFF
jgi:HAMP domain-containing protein